MPTYKTNISFEDVERYVAENEVKLNKEYELSNKDNQKRKLIEHSIIKNYGSLSNNKNAPMFTLIKWGEYTRYDLRRWKDNMETPLKGISFTDEEIDVLEGVTSDVINEGQIVERFQYKSGKILAVIKNHICKLSEKLIGEIEWKKEINIVDWGYGNKVDIRSWGNNYSTCGKGICLSLAEFGKLMELIKNKNR